MGFWKRRESLIWMALDDEIVRVQFQDLLEYWVSASDMEEDDDMGFESEPFDYSSPEDEGDMYGDDMTGYMDKDTDF